MIDIKKSYQLTRFKLAIVLIILALLTGFFLRFFDLIQASIEQMALEINLMNMQQMIREQNLMTRDQDKSCAFLNNPNLFESAYADPEQSPHQQKPGEWHYDAKTHQLAYLVRSKRYFRSKNDHQLIIELYCNKGVVQVRKQPFVWCQDKRLWGCSQW